MPRIKRIDQPSDENLFAADASGSGFPNDGLKSVTITPKQYLELQDLERQRLKDRSLHGVDNVAAFLQGVREILGMPDLQPGKYVIKVDFSQ